MKEALLTSPVRQFTFSSGCIAYDAAWRWQLNMVAQVANGATEAVALLEHAPVYTFGRRVRYEHLLTPPADLRLRGASIVESDRGGDVTFHGPGQLVLYPILDLGLRRLGLHEYVHRLEETVLRVLQSFGLQGERYSGRPGVWVQGAKLAAVGVRVHRGVSMHGLALNVNTDLSWFSAIIPCGISDAGVTSMASILGTSPGMPQVMEACSAAFAEVFDAELIAVLTDYYSLRACSS
jgi:lipoate-protein ligase B